MEYFQNRHLINVRLNSYSSQVTAIYYRSVIYTTTMELFLQLNDLVFIETLYPCIKVLFKTGYGIPKAKTSRRVLEITETFMINRFLAIILLKSTIMPHSSSKVQTKFISIFYNLHVKSCHYLILTNIII